MLFCEEYQQETINVRTTPDNPNGGDRGNELNAALLRGIVQWIGLYSRTPTPVSILF